MMTHSNGERPGSGRAATGETAGSAGDSRLPRRFFILVMPLARFDNDAKAPFSLEKAFSARIVPCRCRPGAFPLASAVRGEQGSGAFFERGVWCGTWGEVEAGPCSGTGRSLPSARLAPHPAPVPGAGLYRAGEAREMFLSVCRVKGLYPACGEIAIYIT